MKEQQVLIEKLHRQFMATVSETNGISLDDTLSLMETGHIGGGDPEVHGAIQSFRQILLQFQIDQTRIDPLFDHPFGQALYRFFKNFPLPYREEHTHLTGSLQADFIYPRLMKLLDGPGANHVRQQLQTVYGDEGLKIDSVDDVNRLVRLGDEDRFDRYLKILLLPKLILLTREAHSEAAYHLAETMYRNYNVGGIRLKFTLSRATSDQTEVIPGIGALSSEDVALGLYQGFKQFQKEQPNFEFILSPCFRKEPDFFDNQRFSSKSEDVNFQIAEILQLLDRFPELEPHLREVDTVGNERNFFSKSHFYNLHRGFRKLQSRGFKIRSHHGETWTSLRKGIQAVDNAMNIWHIDTLEHGLSLGINPNYYFHSIFQRVMDRNQCGIKLAPATLERNEVEDMRFENENRHLIQKLVDGTPLGHKEQLLFAKAKFHTATEVEQYQHDVLNRMIHKEVSLIALPSSNHKLTSLVKDYKDHPFSWWEKKGLKLGVGTDNYVTLNTDYIKEMMILLFTDAFNLKITKLLMVTTGETRRRFLAHVLWKMRKSTLGES
jgi:adenosine deaminase